MLKVEQAIDAILGRVRVLEPERVGVLEAVGRVLAESVVADATLPAWDNSAMDGYAVRHADVALNTPMPVTFEVAAGCTGDRPLGPGEVARIFTGAPIPPGADTVIIQEDADRDGAQVAFREIPAAGANVRLEGNDVRPGDVVLDAGRTLIAGDVGLLAALGRTWVQVVRRPVVSIVSTGDELVSVDTPSLARGQIRNSNALMLAAAVQSVGAIPRIVPIVPDDRAATDRALALGAQADAMLISGGASVGDHDHVHVALRALSAEAFAFWKVKIKPGKPLAFGTIGHCAVFGLPGNPVSAGVTYELFARPALRKMMGFADLHRRVERARLAVPMSAGRQRRAYVRGVFEVRDGELWVDPSRSQSSGALSSLAGAEALVINPIDGPAREAGAWADVLRLD